MTIKAKEITSWQGYLNKYVVYLVVHYIGKGQTPFMSYAPRATLRRAKLFNIVIASLNTVSPSFAARYEEDKLEKYRHDVNTKRNEKRREWKWHVMIIYVMLLAQAIKVSK